MKLAGIILTFNEEQHLERCISNIKNVVDEVVVVDCYSTDTTVDIAKSHGARILQHDWTSHSSQFNWALTQLESTTDWIMRIDADEYLTDELKNEIAQSLPSTGKEIDGITCNRRITFQGKLIKYGGVSSVRVLRLFRFGRGRSENRWMDEHITVEGEVANLKGELIDDNLNSLTWWTDKHNKYASREAVDMLNLEFNFMEYDSFTLLKKDQQAGVKRWIKEVVYSQLPGGFRAFAYFLYRYVICLGFLDGKSGTSFHFLQGFWYRFLVDAKINEVKRYMQENDTSIEFAIERVLGIEVSKKG